MKRLRYLKDNRVHYGMLEGEMVYQLGSPFEGPDGKENAVGPLRAVKILAPCEPTKIICAAKNYPWGETPSKSPRPILFFKPPSSVIGHEENIVYPSSSQHLIFESELVVVMGKAARNVTEKDALKYVLGYTCGNDVTAYDFILRDNATFHGKSFDTFCPLGPFIVTDLDPDDTTITCRVNGKIQVSGSTKSKYYSCAQLVSFISEIMTLFPGDMIMTGTPDIGTINRGDLVEVDINGIGVLKNQVV
ncbi:MAG: 2-keto-4-pentenoate hydratase/2-oxohepta-3-ene,7-dioic acid hydratase [Deltaproteobacteria bacterium]|nr:2-keto-4-pentenoate hydratase/2-oxohepta-3-ene,7-dioic acid hydratase [Deltaproteobacteria bacterium]